MAFPRKFKELCSPAAVYFVVSIVSLIIVLFQNLGNSNSYNVGTFSCRVPSTVMIFIVKLMYILFWTWVLNLICKDGHSGISWMLVFLPWVFLLVFMGMLMINM